jgi:integrase
MKPRLTMAESIISFGERGRELQQQKSAEYWKSLEATLPSSALEQIFRTTVFLQHKVDHGDMKESLAINYRKILIRTAIMVHGELENVGTVAQALVNPQLKGQQKHFIGAYNHFRKANGIDAELGIRRDRRRPLPILTPESTLQASLTIPTQLHWIAYFRLRYETGPRPQEPFYMRKLDIDFDRHLVRFGTFKGSGETLERELPVSPLSIELLRTYTVNKGAEDYVFTKPLIPNKPLDYKDAEEVMTRTRRQLQKTGYNTRGLTLYVYRHAFATRLYHATKDLALVSRSLGHRNIEDTMIYIHLQPDQVRRYDVENHPLNDKIAITKKIAEGWELALQTPMEIYFRRPRWVP